MWPGRVSDCKVNKFTHSQQAFDQKSWEGHLFRNICPIYVSLLRRRCPRIFLVVLQNAACRLVIASDNVSVVHRGRRAPGVARPCVGAAPGVSRRPVGPVRRAAFCKHLFHLAAPKPRPRQAAVAQWVGSGGRFMMQNGASGMAKRAVWLCRMPRFALLRRRLGGACGVVS